MVKIVAAISILVMLFAIAYGLVALGLSGPPAPVSLRELGSHYLTYMYSSTEKYFTASSPEAVSAILWDYRGLDTLYETLVLFTAIIGAVLVYKDYISHAPTPQGINGHPLSLIVVLVSRIVIWITPIIAVTLAFTGQLTPGGGFVGGSAYAVVPVLLILVFSIGYLGKLGFTIKRALTQRALALIAIFTIALAPLLLGAYIFQNQLKPCTSFSYPGKFIDSTPLGGSILLFNLFELFAVSGAFTLSFILLARIAYLGEEVDEGGA